jgi:hypothetical protein
MIPGSRKSRFSCLHEYEVGVTPAHPGAPGSALVRPGMHVGRLGDIIYYLLLSGRVVGSHLIHMGSYTSEPEVGSP